MVASRRMRTTRYSPNAFYLPRSLDAHLATQSSYLTSRDADPLGRIGGPLSILHITYCNASVWEKIQTTVLTYARLCERVFVSCK